MKIECTSIFPKTVMVSGHFDGFHSGHLDYLEQATKQGDSIICIISSDKQLLMKKEKVNIHEKERLWILDTILRGIGCNYQVFINVWDIETPTITEALRQWKPDVLFRGYDKKPETMPEAERKVCKELDIEIVYAKNRIGERHSSEMNFDC